MTWVSYAIGAVPVILVGLNTVMLTLMYPGEAEKAAPIPHALTTAFLYAAIWLAIGSIFYFAGYDSKRQEVDKLISEWPRDRYLT